MDRLVKEKHKRSRRANEITRSSWLDRSTQKDEMKIGDVNCMFTRGTQSVKRNRSVGRPRKRWEDEINDFLRHEESEESEVNDLKNSDTGIESKSTLILPILF